MPRFDAGTTLAYVRLRFVRIWPLYITCTLLAGGLIWVRYQVWHDAPPRPGS